MTQRDMIAALKMIDLANAVLGPRETLGTVAARKIRKRVSKLGQGERERLLKRALNLAKVEEIQQSEAWPAGL